MRRGTWSRRHVGSTPAVVEELLPDVMKLADVQRILQRLLVEGVSIRQLSTILEALGDEATRTSTELELTERVRHRLARTICAQLSRFARSTARRDARPRARGTSPSGRAQLTDREVIVRWAASRGGEFLPSDRRRIGVAAAAAATGDRAGASGDPALPSAG